MLSVSAVGVAVVLMELLSGFDFIDQISPFTNGFMRRINLLSLIVVDRNEKLPAVGHVFMSVPVALSPCRQ